MVGPDGVPIKILKIARNFIDSHLTNILNRDIKERKFSEDAKTVLVRPLSKKNNRDKIQNYRPVNMTDISKVCERYLLNSFWLIQHHGKNTQQLYSSIQENIQLKSRSYKTD